MHAFLAAAACLIIWLPALADDAKKSPPADNSISMVVMDPLAEPLSCPCVQGYAQRKYEKLAEFLEKKLGQPVHVTFAESFENALAKKDCQVIDIAIGKDSVVRYDAAEKGMKVRPVARLTGQDGVSTQTGLIVVRSKDKAQHPEDLKGYRILFGPRECDEKFAASRLLLTTSGVEIPTVEASETTQACSDGASKIIEWGDKQRAAAVISSYAAPLLEGCGTVKKGDLRVIGQTQPVPFITAFTTDRVDRALQHKIRLALLDVANQRELKTALETLLGFVPIDAEYRALRKAVHTESGSPIANPTKKSDKTKTTRAGESPADEKATSAWPGWRGPSRDGRVRFLPETLPKQAAILWRQELHRPGLGGIAATEKFVVLGDRDLSNTFDEFRCFAAEDGKPVWTVQYPAPGQLDYDNVPRATPLIYENRAYLLGAFGDLTCVELDTGNTIWRLNLIQQFDGDHELVWGLCSSPLVVDGKLIVNPGGSEASVVALDPRTGEVVWQTPGARHAYGSFVVATLGGIRQLVGYDQTSLGGWDITTGRRLWTLKPPQNGDFNVPTPVAANGRLLVTTENNKTRLYDFDNSGRIIPRPIATNDELASQISTPIVLGNRAYCVCENMYCLDLANGLHPIWIGKDSSFGDYGPLIASNDRILTVGAGGELLLVDATADTFRIVSRLKPFTDSESNQAQLLSHPALVNTRLYLRGDKELLCIDLAPRN